MTQRTEAINGMLSARIIAIVGASENPAKPGYRLLKYLQQYGYDGRLYPVNPGLQTCQGITCYPRLSELPETPELVGIVVAAPRVPDVLRECAQLGVQAAVVISAGFAESGGEGRRLQEEIDKIAEDSKILLCGPNSVGIVSAARGLTLTFTEALTRGPMAHGSVAMVSQSGAFGTVLYAQARDRGLGIGTYISSGNEASTVFGEYVEALIEQPEVAVVGGYVEGLREFASLKRAAARGRELGKPIVVLKVGQSELAARAAASHTGALVGDTSAYRAALHDHGILQVEDEQELLDVVDALQAVRQTVQGDRVAIITTSGGAGVMLTDLLTEKEVELAKISPEVKAELRRLLPEFASRDNPIDVTGRFVTDPTSLDQVIEMVAADPGVDLVIVFVGLAWSDPGLWEQTLERAADAAVPVIVSGPLLDGNLHAKLRQLGVAVCTSARQTAVVSSALVRWGTWREREPAPTFPDHYHALVNNLPTGVLNEDSAKQLLSAIGLTTPRALVAKSAQQAEKFAHQIGRPVALKAHAPALAHKSEVGGVLLNILPDDVADEYERMRASVAIAHPEARLDSIRVEEMFTEGIEVVIGAVRAEPFGILLAVGAGGIEVEVRRDVAYAIAPVSHNQAREMIDSLAVARLLHGYRGSPAADIEALVDAVVRISQLVAALGERLVEMDVNPVLVRPHGSGVVILDALAVIEDAGNS